MASSSSSSSNKRVVVVTGASSGIGRATSLALAASSSPTFNVVLVGRRQAELDETARLCQAAAGEGKGQVLSLSADVGTEEGVERVFAKAKETFGRVDVVFNNAGVDAPNPPLDELPIAEFDRVMAVNVRGAVLMTMGAMKAFKAQEPQGGRIINNGSISASSPRPNSAPYTISKHAISGLTKCTQLDGRPFSIACSQIDIGNAVTSLGNVDSPKVQADGSRKVEPGFPVDEVARAVTYLAGLPEGTNVANMTIMATNMPFIGRG